MVSLRSIFRATLGGMLAAESVAALRRHDQRRRLFHAAAARARDTGRPLVVIGDPDAGMHTRLVRAYGCGDVCVDARGCPMCPVVRVADITAGPVEGLADDSGVVFVSCVLEYVGDLAAAVREVQRIAGSPENLYIVTVQPWTLTALLYPGARWAGYAERNVVSMGPVTSRQKTIAAAVLGGVALLSMLPEPKGPRDE